MRKIVFSLSTSLDGFFEGPDREIDWSLADDELLAHMNDQFRDASAFLTGRITHELMAAAWSGVADDPDATPLMADFASIWVPKPKYVFSRTVDHAECNATVKREVVVEEIRELQRQPGGDMVVGGPDLARTFRDLDLIDEYWIYVHPVLIGRGHPMFQPTDARSSLTLADTRSFGNGVVRLRYTR
ncbi:dihydrofolate reductase family protein [Kutzneria sp. CA-103260]|uniref:dihydrofolate reductase family protein n=1 Tax=Kutzneria sp. CA-103260 TaxID=2802641 RepID=UPI001BACF1B9|nr:dihydrofolate reductase family protein [Kutzneria sp. CA-103260]QUQ71256.1 dihydrofolate reductase [Kutzneria sp. CA-103260]